MSHFTKGNEHKQVRMRKATEDFMLNHTVQEFRNFILQNAEVEEDEDEFERFIPYGEHKSVKGKTYEMKGEDLKGDEFIITEDGRVFFALSLIENIEVVNDPQTFAIYEGHMDNLMKKVNRIQNKCRKFGCDFHFEQVGEEIREVASPDKDDEGKPIMVNCKFILVKAEGTAIVNGWEFVASVEHTDAGNIFSKAMTNVEIPERYRFCEPCCEHCNTNRSRKYLFIIRNTETGEFKMVGKSCLQDFTNGMSAELATMYASFREVFEEAVEAPIPSGHYERYFDTKEVLQYFAETIRCFGYTRTTDDFGNRNTDSTKDRMETFFHVSKGFTSYMTTKQVDEVKDIMHQVGFNPESAETIKTVEDALTWLNTQEAKNDYMHNLKVACSNTFTNYGRFGILASLFPTYNRELEFLARKKEQEERRLQERQKGLQSEHVGQVGDRIKVDVESIKCLTSWDSCFDGYNTTTTFLWKIVGTDGNIFTWKSSKWMDEDKAPKTITGTIKSHNEFRDVKQTELTRCRVG